MDSIIPNHLCSLCDSPTGSSNYSDGLTIFCCPGCQAVYQILSSQNCLDKFQDHPVFRQALKVGLISNPDLIEQIRLKESSTDSTEKIRLFLEVQEMWCPSCASVISLILLRTKGIEKCVVDYSTDLASIEFNPRLICEEQITNLIRSLGYSPASLHDSKKAAISSSLSLRFVIASFFSLNIMMFSYPIYAGFFDIDLIGYPGLFGWLSFFASIPVLTYCAWPIWKRLYVGLSVGIWGMELLVFMGVFGATVLSIVELMQGSLTVYFDSMTVIIVFVLLGKIIESKAKFSAKDSLIQLTRALPKKGRKRVAGKSDEFVALKEIQKGDQLIILAGEKIVLDGAIIEGEGICDESLMTGESLPVVKKVDSMVLAGTLLQQGYLVVNVTATLEETALKRIIDMVELDVGHKSAYIRASDQIVKLFVPIVLGLAFASGLYAFIFATENPYQIGLIRAISVLLISCPCAIGIAAPLAESNTLNAMAKLGAIVRNRACLALLGKITTLICDKTGTVTEGSFKVTDGMDLLTTQQKSWLKGIVSRSIHPLAIAIASSVKEEGAKFDEIQEHLAQGIKGVINGSKLYLGSDRFLKSEGFEIPPLKASKNRFETILYFGIDDKIVGVFHLEDTLRPEATKFLRSFSSKKTILLSGDRPSSVESVAREAGFKEWHAACRPLEKRQIIEDLKKKGELVLMVGDGINDAPALTSANVGIAVITASDISIQVSDILLTTPKLDAIAQICQLADKGQQIVKQNLFWAFFYNCIGIGLAMAGYLTPLFAASAMVLSSLMIIYNASRLKNVFKN